MIEKEVRQKVDQWLNGNIDEESKQQIQELQECPASDDEASWVTEEIESIQHYIHDVEQKTRGHVKRLEDLGITVE